MAWNHNSMTVEHKTYNQAVVGTTHGQVAIKWLLLGCNLGI